MALFSGRGRIGKECGTQGDEPQDRVIRSDSDVFISTFRSQMKKNQHAQKSKIWRCFLIIQRRISEPTEQGRKITRKYFLRYNTECDAQQTFKKHFTNGNTTFENSKILVLRPVATGELQSFVQKLSANQLIKYVYSTIIVEFYVRYFGFDGYVSAIPKKWWAA